MEENNENIEHEEHHHHHDKFCDCYEKHPFLKCLLYGFLVLLGSFLASYMVADWYFKHMLNPETHMRRMEKAFERQERQMQKDMDRSFRMADKMRVGSDRIIKLEQNHDKYQIFVDLVPLDKNEKNVEIKTNGNVLTVKAADIKSENGKKSVTEITQSYLFDRDYDLSKLTKERQGDTLIITIPEID